MLVRRVSILSNFVLKSDRRDFISFNTTAKLAMLLASVALGELGWIEFKVILAAVLRPRVKMSQCPVAGVSDISPSRMFPKG